MGLLHTYEIIYQPDAINDLENIYEYYLEMSCDKKVAERIIQIIARAIDGLSFMPQLNPIMLDFEQRGLRKLVCDNYIIPFIINDETKTVYVLRIFHGKMNYKNLL
jgi:toxin ParE1/3/4